MEEARVFIRMDDPHPGRCKNLRPDLSNPYHPDMYRCVRMEGHTEACRFEFRRYDYPSSYSQSYQTSSPTPWVEPA